MLWEKLQKLSEENFKRKTGVSFATYEAMVKVYASYQQQKRQQDKRGKASKLTTRDWVLVLLKYYREYPTQLSIASELGVHETTIGRGIREVENILIKSKTFHLPNRKALIQAEHQFEVVVIDVAESPIERPKKKSPKRITDSSP